MYERSDPTPSKPSRRWKVPIIVQGPYHDASTLFARHPPEDPRDRMHDDTDLEEESSYLCDSCGEEIVVPIDHSAGREQEYVEDCPVCCRPHVLFVRCESDGRVSLTAQAE